MSSWIVLLSPFTRRDPAVNARSTTLFHFRIHPPITDLALPQDRPYSRAGLRTLATRFEDIPLTAARVNEFDWMLIVDLLA